ncbi:hypothetical protein [Sphingomonas hominis]|uniref:hypothetical protein n=1 Tax=Sphingomonas hominis TaxID=2741495 RepID=UPI001CB6D2F8|nr:hypothetical protein [Sphingomonas hominis]
MHDGAERGRVATAEIADAVAGTLTLARLPLAQCWFVARREAPTWQRRRYIGSPPLAAATRAIGDR